MLERMARDNPKIDMTRPIPLSTITSEFERMRSERERGGGSSWGGSSWGSDSNEAPKEVVLVPGFGSGKTLVPPRGFGSKADAPAVKVEDADMTEAEERVRRYDRNRDGVLDEDELRSGSWRDDPLQYDRNGDKKLTADELAVRYAKRRMAETQSSEQSRDPRSDQSRRDRGNWSGDQNGRGEDAKKDKEEDSFWKDKASYASLSKKKESASGLPEQFTSRTAMVTDSFR